MADLVLAEGGWKPLPDASFRVANRNPDSLFLFLAEQTTRPDPVTGKRKYYWVATQETLAKTFAVSVRTIQRWIASLRNDGRLVTEYLMGSDSRRYATAFWLPKFHRLARSFHTTPDVVVSIRSKKDHRYGRLRRAPRSNQDQMSTRRAPTSSNGPSPSHSSSTPGAPVSLNAQQVSSEKLGEEEGLDMAEVAMNVADESTMVDNVKRKALARVRAVEGVGGPDVRRVIAWWLAYRKVGVHDGEVIAMARSVEKCLSRGKTEFELEESLFELMMRGLDVGELLERQLGVFAKFRRGRKVTWKRREKPRTSWSYAEMPGLYRETRELPPSSTAWLPLGPSIAKLADARVFEAGLAAVPAAPMPVERVAEAMTWSMADWAAGIVVAV